MDVVQAKRLAELLGKAMYDLTHRPDSCILDLNLVGDA
jgi:hypothetical protein